MGHPQSQRWLAQRQAATGQQQQQQQQRTWPGNWNMTDIVRQQQLYYHDESASVHLPLSIHTYASDDDRSASSINANAHLMHIFRSLSLVFVCHSRLVFLPRVS